MDCAPWHVLAIVPHTHVSTEQARTVLPESLDFKTISQQVAHALGISQALQTGDESLLFHSCVDYMHEPYRKQFIAEYEMVHTYCQEKELPMWISGSGSTLLVLSQSNEKLDQLKTHIQHLDVDVYDMQIAKKGAYVEDE